MRSVIVAQYQHKVHTDQLKQEHTADKQVLDLQISNQQEQLKRLQSDITSLRQEADRANKRVQELAVKTIVTGQPHDQASPPKPVEKPNHTRTDY